MFFLFLIKKIVHTNNQINQKLSMLINEKKPHKL